MSKESAINLMNSAAPQPLVSSEAPKVDVLVSSEAPKELESTVFARLAAKEAKMVKEREREKEASKLEQERFASEREELIKVNSMFLEFEQLKKTNKMQALRKLGFTDNDIFEAIAEAQPKEKTAEDRAAEIAQAEVEKYAKSQEEKAAKELEVRNTEVITRFKTDLMTAITSNAEQFPLSNHYGVVAQDLAYETVVAVLRETGEIISAKEAVGLVEEMYEDQYKALNALKTPKVVVEETVPQPLPQKTLTNRVTASVTGATTAPVGETRDEKKARLADKLRNLGR